ncbi:MAG: hypothetical protein ACJ79S_15750 [Gemmatimonadaceae bacterium]
MVFVLWVDRVAAAFVSMAEMMPGTADAAGTERCLIARAREDE